MRARLSLLAFVLWSLPVRAAPDASIEPVELLDGGFTLGDGGLLLPAGTNRAGHEAILLRDGRVLLTGGQSALGPLVQTEIFDPWLGGWRVGLQPHPAPRVERAALLLPDGRVLVVGGSARAYEPATDTWHNLETPPSGPPFADPGRKGHTATLLLDGRVLVLGGVAEGGAPAVPQVLAALEDGGFGWSTPPLAVPAQRKHHTATLLADGRVLLVGGVHPSTSAPLDDVAVVTPETGAATVLGPAVELVRLGHTATRLHDGKVLVLGQGASEWLLLVPLGDGGFLPRVGDFGAAPIFDEHTATLLPSGEVLVLDSDRRAYAVSLASGTPTALPAAWPERRGGRATLLVDGTVLYTGGALDGGLRARPVRFDTGDGAVLSTGARVRPRDGARARAFFDGRTVIVGGAGEPGPFSALLPDSGTVVEGAAPIAARVFHTVTLLTSGDLLVLGGSPAGFDTPLDECWLLRPDLSAQPCTSLPVPRMAHTATLLANGEVLVAGGVTKGLDVLRDAWLYSHGPSLPAGGKWTQLSDMGFDRVSHSAVLLPDRRVWLAGGDGSASQTSELFDPISKSFSPGPPLRAQRAHHTATLLRSGEVLLTGGHDNADQAQGSAEVVRFAGPIGFGGVLPPAMAVPRSDHQAAALPSGEVVIAGGSRGAPTRTVDVYDLYQDGFSSKLAFGDDRGRPVVTVDLEATALMLGGTAADAAFASWRRHHPSPGANAHGLYGPSREARPGASFKLGLTGPWRRASEASSGGAANSSTSVPRLLVMREDNEEVVALERYAYDPASGVLDLAIPPTMKDGVYRAWAYVNSQPGRAFTFVVGPRPATGVVGQPGGKYELSISLPATALAGQLLDGAITVATPPGVSGAGLALRFTGQLDDVVVSQNGTVLAATDGAHALIGGPSPSSSFELGVKVRATGLGARTFEVKLDAPNTPAVAQQAQVVEVSSDYSLGVCRCQGGAGGPALLLAWALAAALKGRRRAPRR